MPKSPGDRVAIALEIAISARVGAKDVGNVASDTGFFGNADFQWSEL